MKSHSDAAQNEAVPVAGEPSADTLSSSPNSPKHELVTPPIHQKVPDDVDAFDVTVTAIVGPSEVSESAKPHLEVAAGTHFPPATPPSPPPATAPLAPLTSPLHTDQTSVSLPAETSNRNQIADSPRQDDVNFSPFISQEIKLQVDSTEGQKFAANSPREVDVSLASQITEAQELTPLPTVSESPTSQTQQANSPAPEPTPNTTIPNTLSHALPTLPQLAMSFPLPDAKIFSTTAITPEPSSTLISASPSSTTISSRSPPPDAHSPGSPPSAPASPPNTPPRSKSARLAFAVMATALSLLLASQLLDPNWSTQQLLPPPSQSPEISKREPTVFDWICQRVPVDAQGVDQRSQQFVSFQKSESTDWQDVEWKPLAKSGPQDESVKSDANVNADNAANSETADTTQPTAASITDQIEKAEFKTQAGDRVQIGLAQCEVIAYSSRAKVRSQQLVQLPQINSPANQARFFASILNPVNPAAIATNTDSTQSAQVSNSPDSRLSANDDADLAHPLALSLPFVGIARKPHDASRVIEDQLILTEQDLDLRYEPSFDTENGTQAAPSLSLSRYRFEWSQTPEFIEGEARRIEPTSDGRFAPPSLPVGDSFVRLVDLLSQATGPITHLRVLDLPLRYESSQEAELEGRPARKLRWKSHPQAAGYELKIFAKSSLAANANADALADENERILHVDETERVIAPLQTNSFFWTVQAIDEQGLPITALTTPRLENVSARFIIGDDGNRGHRPQDVDPRGLKISKAQSSKAAQDESAPMRLEPLTPLDGEVIVAGTRDTEYGQLTWSQPQFESRSPAAQSASTKNAQRLNAQFELQLATDADFVNVLFTKKVTRAAFKLKGDLPEGSLFYRVRQLPKGEWSSVRKFQLVYE